MKSGSYLGGALVISEDAGKVKVSISKAASLGGGQAAGLLSVEGEASLVVEGELGLKLIEALVNSKLPASMVPLAEAGEAVLNAAVKAIE